MPPVLQVAQVAQVAQVSLLPAPALPPTVLPIPQMRILPIKRAPVGILDINCLVRRMGRAQRVACTSQPYLIRTTAAILQNNRRAIAVATVLRGNAAVRAGLAVDAALRILPPFLGVGAMA